MEYKVGSLADLISGSSTKKSKNDDSGVKIVFQSVEDVSTKHKKRKNKKSEAFAQNEKNAVPKQKRERSSDSFSSEHRKKRRRKEKIVNGSNKPIDDIVDSGDNLSENVQGARRKEKQSIQGGIVSENMKNAKKRLRKKEKKNKTQHPVDEEKESRTIFVKNLPNKLKKSKIRKLFDKYGTIQSVRLRCVALSDPRIPKKVAVIKEKFHPDRSNISAFICFESSESATAALAANGMVIDDHHVLVDKAIQEKTHDQRRAVFVGNVPFAAEEDDLWKLFEGCGNIVDIRIIRDRNTGIGKGFAYVNFESPDAVELALNLNGEKLKERELRISRASKKPKPGGLKSSSFKQTSGHKPKLQTKDWKKNKQQQQHSAHVNTASRDRFQNFDSKFNDENMKKGKNANKINFDDNNSKEAVNKRMLQHSSFQGQTIFDMKKKKHKKKLSKDELKKKIVLKKLGIKSNLPLPNKKKFKQ
ncbi:RNA-binding protein 34 isoform X2 [Anabrus simplex]